MQINCSLSLFRETHQISKIDYDWWYFTGVSVTASFLKSPGLFSVFWPSSIILNQLLNLLVGRDILIAVLRKFYRVSNSIAESPIRKEIFIIAEQRQFFQVFYLWISMPWTQKLWMLNTRLLEFSPSRFFIKKLSKKQIAEICLNTFFLITISAAAVRLKILLMWRLPFLKDFFKFSSLVTFSFLVELNRDTKL